MDKERGKQRVTHLIPVHIIQPLEQGYLPDTMKNVA